MPLETELKLRFVPADEARLRAHPLLRNASEKRHQHMVGTYFDTSGLDLLRLKVGLRIRREGNVLVQTLKTAGSGVGGLHQRQEWEAEVENLSPDFSKLPAEMQSVFEKEGLLTRLMPVFTTSFERGIWLLKNDTGGCVEACIDVGEIRADNKRLPLHEVELELKGGNAAYLYELALSLLQSVPLWVENRSKAQRAYYLGGFTEASSCKNAEMPPMPNSTAKREALTEALHHILSCLQTESLGIDGFDCGTVERVCYAARRLRDILDLLWQHLDKEISEPLLAGADTFKKAVEEAWSRCQNGGTADLEEAFNPACFTRLVLLCGLAVENSAEE